MIKPLFLALALIICGCETKTVEVPVETIVRDTVTVIVRDTVTVHHTDTVTVTKSRIVTKIMRDTVEVANQTHKFWHDWATKYFAAEQIDGPDEVFRGVDSVSVQVTLSDDAKDAVSESVIRTKFELVLRKYGVTIVKHASMVIELHVDGLWGSKELSLTYTAQLTCPPRMFPVLELGYG